MNIKQRIRSIILQLYLVTVASVLAVVGYANNSAAQNNSPGRRASSRSTLTVWTPTSDWRTGLPPSPWQSLAPLGAPNGVTALSGQVLTIDGNPLAKVTLAMGPQVARTDSSGRFLLRHIKAGIDTLLIDGTSANHGGVTFGIFQVATLIAGSRTNFLSYTIWMPVVDTAHATKITSPTAVETVVANPLVPGLELHVPAGTIVKNIKGNVVNRLTITPVPLDRPPFPLPVGIDVPIYFTIQPGGGTLWTTSGHWAWARLIYPNTGHLSAGLPYNFWNYLAANGWYVYGHGHVIGSSIAPDPGVGIWEFSGAMVGSPPAPPPTGPCRGNSGGDPADCSTGIFRHNETDFHLSDVIPINLTRTYVAQDDFSRPFGIGTTDNYELFLRGDFKPCASHYSHGKLPDSSLLESQSTDAFRQEVDLRSLG